MNSVVHRTDRESRRSFLWKFGIVAAVASIPVTLWAIRVVQTQSAPIEAVSTWKVEKLGNGLTIAWNRRSADFGGVKKALLRIQDGSASKEVVLDPDSERGTLFYSPKTESVELRLQLTGTAGESEFVRSLDGFQGTAEALPVLPPSQEKRLADDPEGAVAEQSSRSRTRELQPDSEKNENDEPASILRAKRQVYPVVPLSLKAQLDRDLRVDVYVKINRSGKVVAASSRKRGVVVHDAFADLAAESALAWIFDPPSASAFRNGTVDSVLHFRFTKR